MCPKDAHHGTPQAFCIMHPKDVHHVALCAIHHSAAFRGSFLPGLGRAQRTFPHRATSCPVFRPAYSSKRSGFRASPLQFPRAAARLKNTSTRAPKAQCVRPHQHPPCLTHAPKCLPQRRGRGRGRWPHGGRSLKVERFERDSPVDCLGQISRPEHRAFSKRKHGA